MPLIQQIIIQQTEQTEPLYQAFHSLGYTTIRLHEALDFDFAGSLFVFQDTEVVPIRVDCLYLCVSKEDQEIILLGHGGDSDDSESDSDSGDPLICFRSHYAYCALPDDIHRSIRKLDMSSCMPRPNSLVFHVGPFTKEWHDIKLCCEKKGVSLVHYSLASDIQGVPGGMSTLVYNSLFNVSFSENVEPIYEIIRCGRMPMTTHHAVFVLFGKKILYGKHAHEIVEKAMAFENRDDAYKRGKMKELLVYLRDNHTYLNRIQEWDRYILENTDFYLGVT